MDCLRAFVLCCRCSVMCRFWCIYYNIQTNKSIILNGFSIFPRSLIEHFRTFCFAFVSTSLLFVTFAKIKEKKRKKKRRSSGSQNDVVLFWSSANLFEVAMANRSKRTEGSIDYNETTCCECHTYFTRLPLQ